MNRRKAIRNILLTSGGAVAAGAGYKWVSLNRKPHIGELDNHKALLPELAETIIPRTNTPGAKEAGVGQFIYKMIVDCADRRTQNKFIYGLHDLEQHCQSKYGRSFVACGQDEREATLRHIEQTDKPYPGILGKVQHKFMGTPFFETLKTYTVMGYCTSMLGATQGLAYELVPGTFDACIPLKPGQRSWATK